MYVFKPLMINCDIYLPIPSWPHILNGSVPLSGTGQYSWYDTIRDGAPWSSLRFHCQQYPYFLTEPLLFCNEFSSTLFVPFAVLGTPAEGYQKSGTVRFAILVPFTTSDSGNGNNCVPYCTEPYHSVETSHLFNIFSFFHLGALGGSI